MRILKKILSTLNLGVYVLSSILPLMNRNILRDRVTYLLLAPLQLTLLCFGSAQLALQVQGFRLRRSLFGQNPLHAALHLRATEGKKKKFSSLCLHGLEQLVLTQKNRTFQNTFRKKPGEQSFLINGGGAKCG